MPSPRTGRHHGTRPQTSSLAPLSTGILDRFLLGAAKTPLGKQSTTAAVSIARGEQNRFGETVSAARRRDVPRAEGVTLVVREQAHTPRAPTTAKQTASDPYILQASASIYSVVEALTIRCRAELGVVWIKSTNSDGLVASFVASGRKVGQGPPATIGMGSIPGAVFTTGIVLNMTGDVPEDPSKFVAAATYELITNKTTQHSSLTTPIFARYGEPNREAIGVLQLFGSSGIGSPFTADDERLAEVSSQLLSHLISTHQNQCIVSWMQRVYDPSALLANATYSARVDQNATMKGIDDFSRIPMLVFRAKFTPPEETSADGPEDNRSGRIAAPRGGAFSAVRLRNLRADMVQYGSQGETQEGLRDINRYMQGLEDSWKKAGLGQGNGRGPMTPTQSDSQDSRPATGSRSLLLASSSRPRTTSQQVRPPTAATLADPTPNRGFRGRTMNPDEIEELSQDTVDKLSSLTKKK